MKLFYKDYKYSKDFEGVILRKYKVLHFCFFKISQRIPVINNNNKILCEDNNITYELSDKFLRQFLKNFIITGTNNTVILNKKLIDDLKSNTSNLFIRILGDNNTIVIEKPHRISLSICISRNSSYSSVVIKKNLSTYICNIECMGANTSINIGEDCMFGNETHIMNGDYHPIYDNKNSQLLNPPKNVFIGNHVWIARNVKILKNSVIPDGCIIGTNSLVNKQFTEQNCIIAGVPAKVVKHNVRWER